MRTSGLPDSDLSEIASGCRGLTSELDGASLLVTGATGFFGTWLLAGLVQLRRELGIRLRLWGLARNARRLRERLPELASDACLTLLDADVLKLQLPDEVRPTHILHAATPASERFNTENPMGMARVAAEGTHAVLSLAVERGTHRVLLTSSGAIYGPQPSELSHVDEDHLGAPDPLAVQSAYAEGKRLAELYATAASHTGKVVVPVARCFAFAGPFLPLDAHFAFGNFIRDALGGGPVLVTGDGTPRRSYLYATDLVIWLLSILCRGQGGRAYNVGSEEDLSVGELAQRVARSAGVRCEIRGTPLPGAKIHRYVPRTQRAQNELGLVQSVTLDQMVERWLHWCKGE